MWNSGFMSTKRAHRYRPPGSGHRGARVRVFSGRPLSGPPFQYCVSQRWVRGPFAVPSHPAFILCLPGSSLPSEFAWSQVATEKPRELKSREQE